MRGTVDPTDYLLAERLGWSLREVRAMSNAEFEEWRQFNEWRSAIQDLMARTPHHG